MYGCYIHLKDHAQRGLHDWHVFKGDSYVLSLSSFLAFQNLEHGDCVRHHRCDKCQTLDGGTTHWALPVHNSFGDLDHISRSQQYQTVLTENVMFIFDWVESS